MPFKLKLKKTRQYNVASKSLFVISVELLDGGVADCTLSVESTGQECLDNVCQRQAINQPEFFGLRYINRNQQPRWVQLDRPLKLQLEKYASSHQLYLRVMYYVISGTSLITDEVTRYHYFLQLKNDLVEGRIICDCQQAVVLASYSRQAEYGNHDRERHTVEYLKNLLTFPKQMLDGGQVLDSSSLAETGRLEWLTAAVIQHHMSLNNMSQAQAEEGFITTCQQLRGYGQEMFTAKDKKDQSEVTLAVSLTGVRVLTDTSDTPHYYRWMDITNVINHKRTFSVECQQRQSAAFVLPSPEDGKYVWRMCVMQHTFYMRHQHSLTAATNTTTSPVTDEHRPKFQEHGLSESREELEPHPAALSTARARSASCLELAEHRPHIATRALLPSYRPAPDYETAIQQKYQQQRAEAQLRYQNHSHSQLLGASAQPLLYGSHPDIPRVHYPDVTRHTVSVKQPVAADDYSYGLKFVGNYPVAVNPNVQPEHGLHYVNVYKPPPPYPSNGLASNSTPDLAVASQALNYHRSYIDAHVTGSSPDLVSTRSALNRQYLGYVSPHSVLNYGRATVLPSTHGTYNNLTSVMEPNRIIVDPHLVSDNIQKVYDDRGNVMYSMPTRRIVVVPAVRHGETHEPIYENVPLPWTADGARGRAHSLTAGDGTGLNDRNGNCGLTAARSLADMDDSHYVNAQVIKGARETSDNTEQKHGAGDVTEDMDRMSLRNEDKDYDETPYTSLCTQRVTNNTISKSADNVTSITVTGEEQDPAPGKEARESSYSSSVELDGNNTSKEKKRRRWGVFMGRSKNGDVKSATLGRDRGKAGQPNKHRWSTGLPKYQPLPPSITKETLCQLLERRMSEEQLSYSFESIPRGRGGEGDCGRPYDDNRVRLHPTPANPQGYIDASHITMTVGGSQRFYVVVQANSGEQAALLWECVWQVGARVLALADGQQPRYLPHDQRTITYGQFEVWCGAWSSTSWGGSRRVSVRRGAGPPRTLWHVSCGWPADTSGFLDFISEINSLRETCSAEAAAERSLTLNAPLVLAGRAAGVTLAADLLLHVIDTNQELDIPRTVSLLHQQRAGLLPSLQHYRFLHLLLLHYLQQSRLI
ncbi:unnamed protein product [Danaus chrysippus]|uniref:protein-tyrosine-phosphatase n=1 Tax=Danaus chrysippus TaxID=151541 RepID=A0A8J2QGP5_9NEOP|nr:unnamed protein product [Danaus chrysippus]